MTECAGFFYILHTDRLTSHCVIGNSEYHKWDIAFILLQNFLKFLQTDVTFKRNFFLSIFCIISCNVDCMCLSAFYMPLCRIEVCISGDNVACFYKMREENILGSTSLMGWNNIFHSKDSSYCFFEFIERRGSCIAFIAQHHGSPLLVGHCTCTTIGK